MTLIDIKVSPDVARPPLSLPKLSMKVYEGTARDDTIEIERL